MQSVKFSALAAPDSKATRRERASFALLAACGALLAILFQALGWPAFAVVLFGFVAIFSAARIALTFRRKPKVVNTTLRLEGDDVSLIMAGGVEMAGVAFNQRIGFAASSIESIEISEDGRFLLEAADATVSAYAGFEKKGSRPAPRICIDLQVVDHDRPAVEEFLQEAGLSPRP